jgi:hypothetical protein
MKTRSARWDAAVVLSHQIAVKGDVLYNRQVVYENLDIASGNVTLDRTAAQLGRCALSLAEPLLIPTRTGGLLSPYGYEIAVKRGIVFGDGLVELMPLGVFPIQTAQVDGVTLLSTISATDRTQLVVDARFEDDYQIAAGTNYATAIQAVINAGVSGLTYSFSSTPYTTPLLTFAAQSDRWDAARSMATSIGCELFFDGLGSLVLRPEPLFTQAPVWSINEGAGGVLISATLKLDRGPAYNRVVAVGANASTGSVPKATSTDGVPSSPSYYFGPFGKKPRFFASAFLASTAQCQSAADSILAAQLGVARSLNFGAVPNPALEPGDPVNVTRTALGLAEVHIIDSLQFDLAAGGAMTGSSRARAA